MDRQSLRTILEQIAGGQLGVDEALRRLEHWPLEDLGFARVDHHRHLRRGFPEVIFAGGKQPEETLEIARAIHRSGSPVFVTRASGETSALLLREFPEGRLNERSGTFFLPGRAPLEPKGLVAVLAAGTSDIPVAEEAAETALAMGSRVEKAYDVGVAGLARLVPHLDLLRRANAIVVVAGMEGALPSVVAGIVRSLVIAVPTSVGYGASFGGLSALLAMVNSCASGVVVVNIDNGFGAGFAASLINLRLVEARAGDGTGEEEP